MSTTEEGSLSQPPALSVSDEHIRIDFEESLKHAADVSTPKEYSDSQFRIVYEVEKTVAELRRGKWQRIALQFPDLMLQDAPRLYRILHGEISKPAHSTPPQKEVKPERENGNQDLETDFTPQVDNESSTPSLFILGDTSYGSCCVDEIAAEHVDADVVVHYGRACLSPTARLPAVHIFTAQPLNVEALLSVFKDTYPDKQAPIILTSDIVYNHCLEDIDLQLRDYGYSKLVIPEIIHAPSSSLPNRALPEHLQDDPEPLKAYLIFHVGVPPEALCLTLSSRAAGLQVYDPSTEKAEASESSRQLRRRYAQLTSVATESIFGILINTLSVKNYLHMVDKIKQMISDAGKKSYTFVVGKINAAKIANFAEIGAWVVVGCWESSLLDNSEFWKPTITPFELQLALQRDDQRLWTGQWQSDFQQLLATESSSIQNGIRHTNGEDTQASVDSEEESEPPEFDLRTGKYVSKSRPLRTRVIAYEQDTNGTTKSNALIARAKGEVANIGGQVSPGAEFLRSQKTWKGLGSDFAIAYDEDDDTTKITQGRSGVARGYTGETR